MKVFELFDRLKELMVKSDTADLDVHMTIDLNSDGQFVAPLTDLAYVKGKYVMLIYESFEDEVFS